MRLAFGDCVFDSGTREISRGGKAAPVSPKAFRLLEILAERRPNAVSKEELYRLLWPDTFVSEANLANLVVELRAALGDDARAPQMLRTVPRFGYAFAADAAVSEKTPARLRTPFACRLVWGPREIALDPGENLIGRDQESVVWIDDSSVSRRHARVVINHSGAAVEDLRSKNGTFLNGRRLRKTEALSDGDTIAVGPAKLVLRVFRHFESTKTNPSTRRR